MNRMETLRERTEGFSASERALVYGFSLMVVLLAGLLITAKPAHAKTFTVNIGTDAEDDVPGDGACNVGAFGICTLRAAIQEANAFPGSDTISFKIGTGTALRTIKPKSALPPIYDQVTINGYSQPGASPNTSKKGNNAVLKIELDGTYAPDDASGLELSLGSSNSVVKGLVINRFSYGVSLVTSDNKLQGNFIGTDATGTLDRGNGFAGVYSSGIAPNNQIGGTTPEARNLISGNSTGVLLYGSGDKVQGNFIGTTKNGIGDLGNSAGGVAIATSEHAVGGEDAAAANVIAFNGLHGVAVFVCGTCNIFPTGNRILRNSIHSNGRLGIDLEGGNESVGGTTFNDPGDGDTGPNFLQNYPELTSATTSSGGTTTIKGKLNSTPEKTFTLRFFSNPSSSLGEGRKYVGTKSVITNADGNVSFTFTPSKAVTVGEQVTATATDLSGNTSEFSLGKQVLQQ